MDHKRKSSHRREMIGCAKIAAGLKKYAKHSEESAAWNAKAAEHLFKLRGMLGNW